MLIALRQLVVALCLLICAGSAGCSAFQRPAAAKAYFSIDPGTPEKPQQLANSTQPARKVLCIRMLRVSPPYDGVSFVYHIGPSQFETDYYNNFIAPPASLMTGALIQWIAHTGMAIVCDSSSDLSPDLDLEGNVQSLYIDSSSGAAKAVMTAHFFLTRERRGAVELLFDKTYEGSADVATRSPADFAAGWGKAYRQILTHLTADLQKVISSK